MLLLFWGGVAEFLIGHPSSVKWYHSTGYAPRCLVTAISGSSAVNPFLYDTSASNECVYGIFDHPCTSADVYSDHWVVGTTGAGLFQIDWPTAFAYGCPIYEPANISGLVETFDMFSGLLSENIISIEANHDYLGVVTDAGLCYGKAGQPGFINYVTESGTDCFVCEDDHVYLAEGNRVLEKDSPTDFGSWDATYNLATGINDIWVTTKDGVNTLYVATQSGIAVFERDQNFYYGSENYSQIKAEVGTSINHGHIFAVCSGVVDIINMQHKQLENTITYSGIAILAYENKRLYSK